MAAGAVRFMMIEERPTAVVTQTTTWTEFPKLWGPLLGQVYELFAAALSSPPAMVMSCGRT